MRIDFAKFPLLVVLSGLAQKAIATVLCSSPSEVSQVTTHVAVHGGFPDAWSWSAEL